MGRRMGYALVVLIVAIGLAVYVRLKERKDDMAAVKDEAMTLLAGVEDYQKNEKLYKPMGDLAHQVAFDAAYKMRERRQAAGFDEDLYLATFFDHLIKQARDQGRQDMVKSLTKFRDERGIKPPEGK